MLKDRIQVQPNQQQRSVQEILDTVKIHQTPIKYNPLSASREFDAIVRPKQQITENFTDPMKYER